MAWNGTVTCGYCYRTGHNRRSCPEIKRIVAEGRKKKDEERGYLERSLIREADMRKATTRVRKCSYCDRPGHNRRSCPTLKAHKGYVMKQEVAFRTAMLAHIRALGLAVGGLVLNDSRNQKRGPSDLTHGRPGQPPMFIEEIMWEHLSITTAHDSIPYFLKVKSLRKFDQPTGRAMDQLYKTINAPLEAWDIVEDGWKRDEESEGNRWHEYRHACVVISHAPQFAKPPEDWLSCDIQVNKHFEEREAWMWPSNEDMAEKTHRPYYSCDWWKVDAERPSTYVNENKEV